MKNFFRFKQFTIDQSNCGMKINTDGVLLGALTREANVATILDIGTGTGVIALMLAQRFPLANIEAVEIDEQAAQTAAVNFLNSPFASRLACFHTSFEAYFSKFKGKKFDLILSNPPFFLNSLKNSELKKHIARHTDFDFFKKLIFLSAQNLSEKGALWLILPESTMSLVMKYAIESNLYVSSIIRIRSFADSEPHRSIVSLSKQEAVTDLADFVIYKDKKVYSEQYQEALMDFFTIF